MSLGNPFILGSNLQRSNPRAQKHCQRGSLHSCDSWFLLVLNWWHCVNVLVLLAILLWWGSPIFVVVSKCSYLQDMSFSDWFQTLVSCDSVGFVMSCEWPRKTVHNMTHCRQVSSSFYCLLCKLILASKSYVCFISLSCIMQENFDNVYW